MADLVFQERRVSANISSITKIALVNQQLDPGKNNISVPATSNLNAGKFTIHKFSTKCRMQIVVLKLIFDELLILRFIRARDSP
jgi:hypothetical protein